MPFPAGASQSERDSRLGPKFDRLRKAVAGEVDLGSFRTDPLALAPETILVFELTGSHVAFSGAFDNVDGLEIFGEEEGGFEDPVDGEEAGFLYLTIPDEAAIKQLLSLWDLYKSKKALPARHKGWASVFDAVHDIRRWGPQDRVSDFDREAIADAAAAGLPVRLEVELTYFKHAARRAASRAALEQEVRQSGGVVVKRGFVPQIAYDAILIEVPAAVASSIGQLASGSLAHQPDVFAIRPQSLYSGFEVEPGDVSTPALSIPTLEPILAVIDGVPVSSHPLLRNHLILADPDDLSRRSVGERIHGTAMASLAVWGDLADSPHPLPRKVVARPLTYAPAGQQERFPEDSLIVDDLVRAVREMLDEDVPGGPSHPSVTIINLSLGDANRPFFGRMSAWARAVDWLSFKYGVLFVISAGNIDTLEIPSAHDCDHYATLAGTARTRATVEGMRDALPYRTLIAPAEAVNAMTVGASHEGAGNHPPSIGVDNHDPVLDEGFPSPVSRHGPGFRRSVKPDILMPGGKLRGRANMVARPALLRFIGANQFGGLQVAGSDGIATSWSGATSGAAALASRAAHQIYDALSEAYGTAFTGIDKAHQALVIKSLLIHRASINSDSRSLVEEIFGPPDTKYSHRRKANVLRLFGYGRPNVDESIACAVSRASVWGHGVLGEDEGLSFELPIPDALFGNNTERRVSATLSWFSPVEPSRRAYKSVRLQIEEPVNLGSVGIKPHAGQAARVTSEAGSTFHRAWSGTVKRNASGLMSLQLKVSRKPDSADGLPDLIPFGLVATVEALGATLPVYEQVKTRLTVPVPAPVPLPARP